MFQSEKPGQNFRSKLSVKTFRSKLIGAQTLNNFYTLTCADSNSGLQASSSGTSNLSWSAITSENLGSRHSGDHTACESPPACAHFCQCYWPWQMSGPSSSSPGFRFSWERAWPGHDVWCHDTRSTLVAELTLRMHWLEHPPPASAHCHLTIDIPPSPSQPAHGRLRPLSTPDNRIAAKITL